MPERKCRSEKGGLGDLLADFAEAWSRLNLDSCRCAKPSDHRKYSNDSTSCLPLRKRKSVIPGGCDVMPSNTSFLVTVNGHRCMRPDPPITMSIAARHETALCTPYADRIEPTGRPNQWVQLGCVRCFIRSLTLLQGYSTNGKPIYFHSGLFP